MGGSQGASSINTAAVDAMNRLTDLEDQIQIIHQTGNLDIQSVKEAYNKLSFVSVIQPFFDNMEDVYSATDMAICRSGASTLAELNACGIPAVLVPYPYATNDHQTYNALALEKNGAALMIKNADLNGELLANTIRSLIQDKEKLADMAKSSRSMGRPDAAVEIARAVLSIALDYQQSKAK
jgi:UDP-N-acetylglucosamine--N-acetylmuramyl-(pentapeptide) pyrophosphoryl-undecaprenol N-acetylglucosamine transferase